MWLVVSESSWWDIVDRQEKLLQVIELVSEEKSAHRSVRLGLGDARIMSLASYQGWDGAGAKAAPKVYQCVKDASPYRWPQQQQLQHRNHHQAESTKANVSTRPLCVAHNSISSQSDSYSETTIKPTSGSECTGGGASASPVSKSLLEYGECGPVSSYVLPSLAAFGDSERVSLGGKDVELVSNSFCPGWRYENGLRCALNGGGHLKVHPHDHDDDDLDSGGLEGSKQPLSIKGGISKALNSASRGSLPPTSLFQDCVQSPALSSSSSSIGVGGEHSFSSDGSEDNTADGEVQSALRAPPLSGLSALEDALPIKRGLSRYFTGQSKSFGCLSDALSTSLAKPANPYAKRRKNFALVCDERQRTCPPVSRKSASGISKKNTFGNRSNLALAVAMKAAQQDDDDDNDNDEDNILSDEEEEEEDEEYNDHPTPLPRMGLGRLLDRSGPSRSYSLSDLQGAGRG